MVGSQTFGGKVIERRVRQIMQLRVPVIGDEPAAVFCLGVVLFSQRLIERGVAFDGVEIQPAAKIIIRADENFDKIGIEARVVKAVCDLEIAGKPLALGLRRPEAVGVLFLHQNIQHTNGQIRCSFADADLLRHEADEIGRDVVVANKTDLLADPAQLDAFRAHVEEAGYTFMAMSAATHQGTRELVQAIAARLAELPPVAVYEPEYVPRPPQIDTSEPLNIQQEDNTWLVEGPWLQRLMANINFSDYESRMYFDKMLRQSGLFDQLERMGIQDGDIVSMYNLEFEYQR